jgi:SpoVK/Ycf46/Vps4 family AAA+-type ATPase
MQLKETKDVSELAGPVWNRLTPEVSLRDDVGPLRTYFIPERFRRKVVLHVTQNLLADALLRQGVRIPLMLGIQGPSGSGKSWQTRVVCAEMGLHIVRVSGAALSSRWEGVPQDLLREAYLVAAHENRGIAALLIDDFDTSPASISEDVQYTVNTQVLCGALMNIADDPRNVSDQSVNRVPVVLTGNRFTAIYYPLTRIGRMSLFNWDPNRSERQEIIKAIFSDIDMTEEQLAILASLTIERDGVTETAPISFYDDVKRQFWEDYLWQLWLQKASKQRGSRLSTKGDRTLNSLGRAIEKRRPEYDFESLMRTARRLQAEHHAMDYVHS